MGGGHQGPAYAAGYHRQRQALAGLAHRQGGCRLCLRTHRRRRRDVHLRRGAGRVQLRPLLPVCDQPAQRRLSERPRLPRLKPSGEDRRRRRGLPRSPRSLPERARRQYRYPEGGCGARRARARFRPRRHTGTAQETACAGARRTRPYHLPRRPRQGSQDRRRLVGPRRRHRRNQGLSRRRPPDRGGGRAARQGDLRRRHLENPWRRRLLRRRAGLPDHDHQDAGRGPPAGLDQVKTLSAELDVLLRGQGLKDGAVGERLAALSKRPDQLWPNTDAGRAQLIQSLNEQTEAIRKKMPQVFRTLPKAPVEIVRVPPEIEDGAPNGYATPPTLDGSRPGRFYIYLKDTAEWPKFTLPTLTYHEALPGHQWDGAIALMSTHTPMLRRVGLGFSACSEGWALYAEQLADELGSYEGDPLGKIGFLQSLQFRAVRLVVDTGMHAKRWSREKATDYMVETTGMPRNRVQREIDRYCIWPGQACSYKIGHTEWVRLREEAKARTGAKFDIKTFHDVLRQGAMPLVVLEQVVKTTFPG